MAGNDSKEKGINTNGSWKKMNILGIEKYKDRLDVLEKQIKEKNKSQVENKETKKALHNLVKDAYAILIDRLWYKIDSFKTRLEVQVLNNEIKTKKLLRELQNEILATNNAKEKEKNRIELQTKTQTPNKPKNPKAPIGKSTTEIKKDDPTFLEKIQKNRILAWEKVEKYINTVSQKAAKPLRAMIWWLAEKAK